MLPGLSFRVKKATVCLRGAHPFFLSMMYFVRHCHFYRFLCISNEMRVCVVHILSFSNDVLCTSLLSDTSFLQIPMHMSHHKQSHDFFGVATIEHHQQYYYCTHDHPALTSCYDTPTVPPWCTSIIFETITRLHWCQCSSSATIVAHLCQYSLSKSTGEKMMMNTYTQADLMPPYYDSDDSSWISSCFSVLCLLSLSLQLSSTLHPTVFPESSCCRHEDLNLLNLRYCRSQCSCYFYLWLCGPWCEHWRRRSTRQQAW